MALRNQERKQPNKITEGTLLPISMVILCMGAVVWITQVHSQTNQNTREILAIRHSQEEEVKALNQLVGDMSEIKGYLKGRNE